MEVQLAQELLNELGSSLENLETQHAALLEFLKGKGIVTDEQLAPYLSRAGDASSVRWRAAHVRLEHLISAAEQSEQQAAKQREEREESENQTHPKEDSRQADGAGQPAMERAKPKEEANEEKNETKHERSSNQTNENRDQGNSPSQQREKDAA